MSTAISMPARAWRKLRREGFRGVLEALKWKYYRHKDMIWCERDATLPLREYPRVFHYDMEIRRATIDDLDLLSANFPYKREWYRERLENPDYHCDIAIIDGEVAAHNWFCFNRHFDPEMRCTIELEPGSVYWFEGWCQERYRGHGVGYLGMKFTFERRFPELEVKKVCTLLEKSNRATRRFHRRFHFEDIGRMVHLRIGPFYYNSRIKPLRARDRD